MAIRGLATVRASPECSGSPMSYATTLKITTIQVLLSAVIALFDAPARAQSPPSPATPPSAEPAPVEQLPPVVVIGTTPVSALGVPIDKYAGNVQSIAPGALIQNENLLDISDLLYRNFGSVNIN